MAGLAGDTSRSVAFAAVSTTTCRRPQSRRRREAASSPSRRPRNSRTRRPPSGTSGHGPARGVPRTLCVPGYRSGVGSAGEGPVRVRHLGRPEVVENAHARSLCPIHDSTVTNGLTDRARWASSPRTGAWCKRPQGARRCQSRLAPKSNGTVLQSPPLGSTRYAEGVEPSSGMIRIFDE